MLAGSILFLEADTWYEIELTREGGSKTTIHQKTRKIPTKPTGEATYYVKPGNGGGAGTLDNPYKGISAIRNANPKAGDTYIFLGGT